MKVSENTSVQLDLKTVIAIISITASFVGMYYTLQADIEEAKKLPPTEVTRLEYELKEEWNEKMILQLKDKVEMLEQTSSILKEEIKITSAMLQDGTEADGKFEELQRQLEELENRKPKTTVIVKEVTVDKKGRKL
jgi:DNA repair exonuclease SbcCD ATPase subunit